MVTDLNKTKPSNEELIALIQEEAAKLGRTPLQREFPYRELVRWRFGSWTAFLRQVGMEPPSRKRDISAEELIQRVQERAAELGRTPFKKEFELSHFANRQFGTWSKFINSAGLELAENPRSRRAITNEELIGLIQQETAKLSRVPMSTEFEYRILVRDRFGSWKEFMDQAGLEMSKLKTGVTNEELIALVQQEAAEKGRTPLKKEFKYGGLITTRFGNWGKFLQQAGLEAGTLAMSRRKISNEQLIKMIHEKTEELGRTPFVKEFEYSSLVAGRFGNWGNFLSAAKLEPSEPRWYSIPVTDEELIELVQKKAAELGRSPKAAEFHYGPLAKSRFRGWKNFLKSAGLDPKTPHNYKFSDVTNDRLIELVQLQAEKLDRTPVKNQFEYGTLAAKRYGTWTGFLKSAGLEPVKPGKPGEPVGPRRKITNEQLIERVREQAEQMGRTPRMREFEYGSLVAKRFGGWKNFLQNARMEPHTPIHNVTNKELIQLVQQQEIDSDQEPTAEDFKYSSTAIHRYGSWENFLEAAGLGPHRHKRLKKRLSNNHLIALVQKQAEELGRTPKFKEFKHSGTIVKRYGTWNSFLEIADLKPRKGRNLRRRISNEQLIELVQKQAEESGRTPRAINFKHYGIAQVRYGSWNNFLESAGLEPVRSLHDKRYLSDEELIELVQKQAKEQGETPTLAEFEYRRTVKARYGRWGKFLESAGLEPRIGKSHKRDISNEDLIERVHKRAEELGRTPGLNEFDQGRRASTRFGTWNNFLESAGLRPRRIKQDVEDISNEELIELVRKQAKEQGETPTVREFRYRSTVTVRYGSWSNFLESAGLEPRRREGAKQKKSNEELIELVQKQAKQSGRPPTSNEFYYSDLAKKRYGGWKNFLESAGLDYQSSQQNKRRISNEQLIELVQKQAKESGETPTFKTFDYGYLVTKRYGSWEKFLANAGLELKRAKDYHQSISNEQLIALVQKQAEELDRTPTYNEFDYGSLAANRYGKWSKFLESAGLELRRSKLNDARITNEQLIELVQKQAKELGKRPMSKEFAYGYLVRERFGSWKNFLKSAGLEWQKPKQYTKPISNEQLIAFVQKQAKELGRTPTYDEFDYRSLAIGRYGRWNEFIESAGLESRRHKKSDANISNKQLIAFVRKKAKELGRNPTVKEFEYSKQASMINGSWNNFLYKAGLRDEKPQGNTSFGEWLKQTLK